MKIAILSFYSGHVSRGVESFVHEIASKLSGTAEITVYQAGPKSKSSYPVISLPFKLYLPSKARPSPLSYLYLTPSSFQIKRFIFKVLKQFKSDPPDILMPLNNGWMSLFSKIFCLKHKTKLILPGFSGIGWDDRVNLWLNPDVFIACTDYQAQWAKKINPRANVKAINIGVNTDRFKPEGKKFKTKLKPPIVLSVAGPQKYKRIDLAIQAVNQLRNASLLVVGQQPANINQLGEKLLGSRYQNIQVDYQNLDPVYRAADIFTLPSESHEAYGISILEALASNLPVVVNRDEIRKELVGHIGLLVDPTDLNQYTQALKTALNKNFGNRPRQQALKFSWDAIANQYLKLWQSLVN